MAKSKQEIIDDITKHFNGKKYSECYVGIATDARKRLFSDHNVSEENGHWIFQSASSHTVAREIERHFLVAGMDGGEGGGDESSDKVYAYKKTSTTKP